MTTITEVIIMFVLGIVGDMLITLYYLFVGRLQALPASLMTILVTLLNFFVIEQVVISTNWFLILIYASGSALGCFSIIMSQKVKAGKNKKKR
jgi:hypothetical protein